MAKGAAAEVVLDGEASAERMRKSFFAVLEDLLRGGMCGGGRSGSSH